MYAIWKDSKQFMNSYLGDKLFHVHLDFIIIKATDEAIYDFNQENTCVQNESNPNSLPDLHATVTLN